MIAGPPSPSSQRGNALVLVCVLAAAGIFGWFGFRDGGWFRAEADSEVRGVPVRRGQLRITVVQSGNLSARNAVTIKSEVEGRVQILSLEDEGTYVEEGDLVGMLDDSELKNEEVAQDIQVQNAQAEHTKALQGLEIQKSQNTSDIAQAKQDLFFAHTDLEQFVDNDKQQELDAADEAIVLAEEELRQAQDWATNSRQLNREGFLTDTELEADELAEQRAQIAYDQAVRAKNTLEKFELPKQEQTLKAAVEEAERELARVELQANARLVDGEAAVRTTRAKLDLETEDLKKIRDQIAKCRLIAPAAGYIVYAREEGRWGGDDDLIEEGVEVRERQEIITIPQSGGMMAEASLHESVIKKVEAGQPCIVRVDAIPGEEYHGEVAFVALLPDSGSFWANPDQRLFRTQVSIHDGSTEMRPGMSCSVEILVEQIPDTLYVPVQAVFRSGGKNLCFVNGEPRTVEAGANSEKWTQILSGVEKGEIVQLAPPPGFAPEPEERDDEEAGEAGPPGPQQPGENDARSGGRQERPPGDGSGEPRQHGQGDPSQPGAATPESGDEDGRPGR